MLDKENLEKLLNYKISNEKFAEIQSLPFQGLERIRNNLTGRTFNRLYVLGRAPSVFSSGRPISCWWCICSCEQHNIISIRGNNLTSNNSKSCGCLDREVAKIRMSKIGKKSAKNIAGCRFGKLVALSPTTERKNNSVVWKCQCDCGNIHYAELKELNRGSISSCGCLKTSKGVLKIEQLLIEHNIPYVKEITFPDCIFADTEAHARFDFFIDNKFLLEFDGIQHYEDKEYFRDSLTKRQEHDEYKNQYCKKKHILLKRIPYWDYKNITIEKIMGDEYLCI